MNTQTGLPKQLLAVIMVMAIWVAVLVACGKKEEAPSPASPPLPMSPRPLPPIAKSPPPSSPLESVDRILASMDWANIAFNSPQKINLVETAQIQLLLSLQKPMDELSAAINCCRCA